MRFEELDRVRKSEKRAVVATLVATKGTTPRKEGASMFVGASGAILGSVSIGGCVDPAVVRASEDVLRDSEARLLSLDVGDEEAHALGLTCAGTLDVLVRALDFEGPDPMLDAWRRVRDWSASGGRAVVVVPLDREHQSSVLVVFDDATTFGTLGSDELDREAAAKAAERIEGGGSRTVRLEAATPAIDAFFEVHGRGPLLLVVGSGAISGPLSRMARELGMHVVVVEGRDRFADERGHDADEVLSGMPSEIVASKEYDASSAIVVVAHDHKFDVPVLREALKTGAGYVGMLGSRRRAAVILEMLRESGQDDDSIRRIRTPIGLDIGGQTAGEIAVSILAEIVAVRNGRPGGPMRDRDAAVGRT
jgi:xanthine dehydrogenase accessory factor